MRGGDSTGLRAFNERQIISAILRAGVLSKADIARETGLSGQAASVIVNRLIDEHILVKRDKVRGQVGQPSTPIAVNPDGAFSVGVRIGRRSVEAVVVNLPGEIVARRAERHTAPLPEATLTRAGALAREVMATLVPVSRTRLAGLGVAMPDNLDAWAADLGLPPTALSGWATADVEDALSRATGLPATRYNDATAACAAEMIAGGTITTRSALYISVGIFVGGGIVLDGRLFVGEQRNAGAIGSMPISPDGHRQLLQDASLIGLERRLEAHGLDPSLPGADGAGDAFAEWEAGAAPALARAIVTALAVVDFETVVVDGLLPEPLQRRLTASIGRHVARMNRAGLSPATIVPGTVGAAARVLGAALLPLRRRFSPDTDLLVRASRPEQGAALRRSA